MLNKVILFYSAFIISVICLLYIEFSVLLILFENGNLFTVMRDMIMVGPLVIAVIEFLNYEINFYISLLMFISLIATAILIESLEEEENESRTNNN